MRRRGRSSAGQWALGALLVVALVGGVAWAETQVVPTPPGPDVTVVAVLVPGPGGGGEVCGDRKGDDHVMFNIGGDIVVHGEVCVGNDLNHTYTVTIRYRDVGQWLDITVHNDDTSEVVYMDVGHPGGGMPGSVSATGEQIISLTAE
ncbi:MAG: hypothetical protein ACYS0K_02145 [Planctomycetota bacterium]